MVFLTTDAQLLARAYLNDLDTPLGDVYTDAVLFPFVNSAYRDLQRRLVQNGVSVMIRETDLTIPTGNTILSDLSSPPLPLGFIVPHSLRERPDNSSEKFQQMQKHVSGLPDMDADVNLNVWEWRDNAVQFVGATRDVIVKLRYEVQLDDLTQSGPTSNIVLIRGAEEALALRISAMASRSRGVRTESSDLQSEYMLEVDRMVRRNRKPEQRKSRRRRPYGFRNYYWQFRY
jgi:hypothetical protein